MTQATADLFTSSDRVRRDPDQGWEESTLENLGRCPVCKSPTRTILFSDVTDGFFGVPGRWTIMRCSACDVAYLDPRPKMDSIDRAYEVYYTHEGDDPERKQVAPGPLAALAPAMIELRDDIYRRLVWPERSPVGRLVRPILKTFASRPMAAIACKFRHLQPVERKGARLLDVGCGNGAFLPTAMKLGYDAMGIDPDATAVAQGRAKGLNLQVATLETFEAPPQSFDHITLSHVLEHFHDPVAALTMIERLLVPGGRLWLVQPNLGSIGLREFGPHWRGLETPRHLTLMTPKRLISLLESLSFVRTELQAPPYEASFYYQQSLAVRNGRTPGHGADKRWPKAWRRRAREADRLAFADHSVCESMTVIAFKRNDPPRTTDAEESSPDLLN